VSVKIQRVVLRDNVTVVAGLTKTIDMSDRKQRTVVESMSYIPETGEVMVKVLKGCKLNNGKPGVIRFSSAMVGYTVDADESTASGIGTSPSVPGRKRADGGVIVMGDGK
jgi:hypothetical protein